MYALTFEAFGNRAEALRVVNKALVQNDQMQEVIALKQRLQPIA